MAPTRILLAAALAVAGPAYAADITEVAGEPSWTAEAKATAALFVENAAASGEIAFPPLAVERIDAMKAGNREGGPRALQVGVARSADEAAKAAIDTLDWQAVDGGQVAYLDVVSPGALGLRVGIDPSSLGHGSQLRVVGDGDEPSDAMSTDGMQALADGEGRFWTTVTRGERQRIELFVPAGMPTDGVRPRIGAVSHLVVSMHDLEDGVLKGLGDSGECNINAVCGDGVLPGNYVDTRKSVAWMNFVSDGRSYVCTGTLLNDTDNGTQIPWFYTAHHCIGTQAEANTLVTFWNREASTCGGTGAGANTRVDGGAQMVYSQSSTDAALLRLGRAAPAGAVFAGWNAGAIAVNTDALAIHHPSGDNKKVSRGVYSGTTQNINIGGQTVGTSLRVRWLEGTTEGGSSGSGLFTLGQGGYQLRGGLFGGQASCDNEGQSEANGNRDFYSSLQVVFPAIQQYLAPTVNNGPSRDYTGQWHNEAESGRGLSMFQFGDTLFALWFVYDAQGRALWYQLDPAWTGADVARGRVVRWSGPPWGPNYNPNNRTFTEVGNFTLTFTSAGTATFAYNVDGVNRTIQLTKITVD